jgi:hypothetical protein
VRPLFLFRWLTGREAQRARFDLAFDSVGLELGAAWWQPEGQAFASRAGIELGLGIEVPLGSRATGPWIGLHGGIRWSEQAFASGIVQSADDRSGFVALTISWHAVFVGHLVDVGDEAPR